MEARAVNAQRSAFSSWDATSASAGIGFGSFVPILLQKSFCTADQFFCEPPRLICIALANPLPDIPSTRRRAACAPPDGNLTGFADFEGSIAGKWLEILTEIAPDIRRVGAILHPETRG
jgi:hypothetical protein